MFLIYFHLIYNCSASGCGKKKFDKYLLTWWNYTVFILLANIFNHTFNLFINNIATEPIIDESLVYVFLFLYKILFYTHTHTHTHIYIYIYIRALAQMKCKHLHPGFIIISNVLFQQICSAILCFQIEAYNFWNVPCIPIYIYIYIYTHTHTYIYIYIYTQGH